MKNKIQLSLLLLLSFLFFFPVYVSGQAVNQNVAIFGCANPSGGRCNEWRDADMFHTSSPTTGQFGGTPDLHFFPSASLGFVFNGSTWDAMRSNFTGITAYSPTLGTSGGGTTAALDATQDGGGGAGEGVQLVAPTLSNGVALFVRQLTADATAEPYIGDRLGQKLTWLWDGSSQTTGYAKAKSASVTTLTETVSLGTQLTTPLSTWSETDSPAAATQAIASKAAGAAGIRHVATSVTACFTDSDSIDVGTINLRDGATGAGTVLWTAILAVRIADDSKCITTPITFIGTAATAITLEFAAAGTANSLETVTLTGYSVQ